MASDGSYWVMRNNVWLLTANTILMTKAPKEVANLLAPILADQNDASGIAAEFDRILNLLSKRSSYIPLKQKVSDDIKNNIDALGIKGLNFEPQEDRYYPEASSAAQLMGFVGKDTNGEDLGYFGLEGYYNLSLSGKPGFIGGEKDAKGVPILINGTTEVSAISGVDLVTSIDKRIQILAEEKLAEGIQKYGAKGGSVTIMDPSNGAIFAMASSPSFDPNEYQKYSDSVFRNPVISNNFEPGSIFKPVVMASALDAGVINTDTVCDICGGPINVDGYQIETWNNKYRQNSTMDEIIINSDNVGMSFIGQKLGQTRMYDYLQKFGFGKLTGVDLQGESTLSLRKKDTWSNVDLDTASFGQGVAVTGIQMIRGIAAIANGGFIVSPHVVTKIQGDGWEESATITPPARIISETAAQETTQMMVDAANLGEAKWTKIPGFSVAAKTGTAQIPVAGHYDATNTNHSFVGFAPAVNPKFIMLVTLDSPQSSPWAAETAAPLWYSIAKDLFPYLGVLPSQ